MESYLELTPNDRIWHFDKFGNPNLPGEMQATIALGPVFCGTGGTSRRKAFPPLYPPKRYVGWQESLTLLAKRVEVEIPDQP